MTRSLTRSLAAALLCASAALAQCPFNTVTAQSVGPFCNTGPTGCCAIVSSPTILAPTLDVTTCALDLEVSALEGCCGVTVAVRLLALGATTANIPLPQLGAGCALWVQPDAILVQQSSPFRLAIPPGLLPFTFFAQSSAIITNVLFPAPTVVTLSEALALSLQ
jgi:hypothetical protein